MREGGEDAAGSVAPFTPDLMEVAVVVLLPTRCHPMAVPVRGSIPMTSGPDVVAGRAVPVSVHPDVVGTGAIPLDDHLVPRGGRPFDFNSERDVGEERRPRERHAGHRGGDEADPSRELESRAAGGKKIPKGLFHRVVWTPEVRSRARF